ncbi:50S ribosomal protein L18 [Candidatus Xianfuyuplasma coldseepsis]|uniref:Large ribosomal subunit protein uL18 n=1 Tax=Candidatus Xianfuyuplasma coldseepsis TaxID=2782163 RepID=A0A7L7KTA8_9MOLU|nr:50S ribosomal protein L18 [Xianfuyuplasma coldseepsis]QMS85194.1 50S ribosomal protein L18 [Xianfuyuplasma coldseepsis]
MIKTKSRNLLRKKRHLRIRKRLVGTPAKPRLNVFRSNKNIYVQIIDDVNGVTLVSASSNEKDSTITNGGNIEAAKAVGTLIAQRALKNNINTVVFDRSGYLYHGRVKALADAARAAGLVF